jgi:hypothetical protein
VAVEAISWALNHARCESPTQKLVLIALANHASPDGTGAFPSVERICRYTCLSERTVRATLGALVELGLIFECDRRIVEAYIPRADRRPKGYNLAMNEVREMQVVDERGANDGTDGVQMTTERGATLAPKTSIKPSLEPSFNNKSEEAVELCNLLSSMMVKNGCRPPTVSERWLDDMDRLMRLDGRDYLTVRKIIIWAQSNEFWRGNILSPTKLRQKFDTLLMQSQRGSQPKGFQGVRDFLEDVHE